MSSSGLTRGSSLDSRLRGNDSKVPGTEGKSLGVISDLQKWNTERQNRKETRSKLFGFIKTHAIPREIQPFDGSIYEPSEPLVLMEAFEDLKKEFGGDLTGKTLLDFGAGDLRVALIAHYLFGMKVLAVEKDDVIAKRTEEILKQAVQADLVSEGGIEFKNTSAFDVSWSDRDVIFFYYTEPTGKEQAQKFRERLREKFRNEAGSEARLALIMNSGNVLFGEDPAEGLESHDQVIYVGHTMLDTMVLRIANRTPNMQASSLGTVPSLSSSGLTGGSSLDSRLRGNDKTGASLGQAEADWQAATVQVDQNIAKLFKENRVEEAEGLKRHRENYIRTGAFLRWVEREGASEKRKLKVYAPPIDKALENKTPKFRVEFSPNQKEAKNINVFEGENGGGRPIILNNQFSFILPANEWRFYALKLLHTPEFSVTAGGEDNRKNRSLIHNWWPGLADRKLMTEGKFSSTLNAWKRDNGEWKKEGTPDPVPPTTELVADVDYMIMGDSIIFTHFRIADEFRGTYIATSLYMEIVDSITKDMQAKGKRLLTVRFLYEAPGAWPFVRSLIDQRLLSRPLVDHGGYFFLLDPQLVASTEVSGIAEKLIPALEPSLPMEKRLQDIADATLSAERQLKFNSPRTGFLVPRITAGRILQDPEGRYLWTSLAQTAGQSTYTGAATSFDREEKAAVELFFKGRLTLPLKHVSLNPAFPDLFTIEDRDEFRKTYQAFTSPEMVRKLADDKAQYPDGYNKIHYFALRSSRSTGLKLLGLFWVMGNLSDIQLHILTHIANHAARALEANYQLAELDVLSRQSDVCAHDIQKLKKLLKVVMPAYESADPAFQKPADFEANFKQLRTIQEFAQRAEEILKQHKHQDHAAISLTDAATEIFSGKIGRSLTGISPLSDLLYSRNFEDIVLTVSAVRQKSLEEANRLASFAQPVAKFHSQMVKWDQISEETGNIYQEFLVHYEELKKINTRHKRLLESALQELQDTQIPASEDFRKTLQAFSDAELSLKQFLNTAEWAAPDEAPLPRDSRPVSQALHHVDNRASQIEGQVRRWKRFLEKPDTVLFLPKSGDAEKWKRISEYLTKTRDNAADREVLLRQFRGILDLTHELNTRLGNLVLSRNSGKLSASVFLSLARDIQQTFQELYDFLNSVGLDPDIKSILLEDYPEALAGFKKDCLEPFEPGGKGASLGTASSPSSSGLTGGSSLDSRLRGNDKKEGASLGQEVPMVMELSTGTRLVEIIPPIVGKALEFESKLTLQLEDGIEANLKEGLSLLTLPIRKGSSFVLKAEGQDDRHAADIMATVLEVAGFAKRAGTGKSLGTVIVDFDKFFQQITPIFLENNDITTHQAKAIHGHYPSYAGIVSRTFSKQGLETKQELMLNEESFSLIQSVKGTSYGSQPNSYSFIRFRSKQVTVYTSHLSTIKQFDYRGPLPLKGIAFGRDGNILMAMTDDFLKEYHAYEAAKGTFDRDALSIQFTSVKGAQNLRYEVIPFTVGEAGTEWAARGASSLGQKSLKSISLNLQKPLVMAIPYKTFTQKITKDLPTMELLEIFLITNRAKFNLYLLDVPAGAQKGDHPAFNLPNVHLEPISGSTFTKLVPRKESRILVSEGTAPASFIKVLSQMDRYRPTKDLVFSAIIRSEFETDEERRIFDRETGLKKDDSGFFAVIGASLGRWREEFQANLVVKQAA
jgi:phosphotransferase system HPr-like phosphotransfer protein